MSEWTPPITTVGALIERLQAFELHQEIRIVVDFQERRIAAVLNSDDPRDTSTVYLAPERSGDPTPVWVDDAARGLAP